MSRSGAVASVYDPLATDVTRLGKWRSAIANRQMRVLVVADSWGDGVGTTGSDSWYRAWIRELATILRTTYFPTQVNTGGSYIQAGTFATSATAPTTFTLAGGASFQDYMGFGRRCIAFGSVAATVTFSFTGTGFDLYYGTNGQSSTFTYTVDGGAVQTVNTAAASSAIETPGYRVQVTGLASGVHTVVATAGALSLNSFISGVITYNGDETQGVAVFDNAKTNEGTKYWTTQAYRWLGQATTVDPQLIIIALGINDFQESVERVPSATYKAKLKELVTSLRAAVPSNPSIVFCVPPEPGGVGLSPWPEFPAAMKQVAAEDGAIAVFDSRMILGDTIKTTNVYGYRSDTYHVNNAGHQAYADALARVITRFP